jgi:hypothetical protein
LVLLAKRVRAGGLTIGWRIRTSLSDEENERCNGSG